MRACDSLSCIPPGAGPFFPLSLWERVRVRGFLQELERLVRLVVKGVM